MNSLLNQFVKENKLPPESTAEYRKNVNEKTKHFDKSKYSHGATYVPAKVAISMKKQKETVSVLWDDNYNEYIRTKYMTPQLPKYIYRPKICTILVPVGEFTISVSYTLGSFQVARSALGIIMVQIILITSCSEVNEITPVSDHKLF